MEIIVGIRPLFIVVDNVGNMGKAIVQFMRDDYNKELGSSLIDAQDDREIKS